EFVARFAACDRLVDRFEPQRGLASLAEEHRQLAKRQKKARQKPCLAGLFEPASQLPQPGFDIAALGRHQTVEAASPNIPETYGVTLGMVEQHRAVARGGVDIARPIGDRACPLAEYAAKGQGLPDGVSFLDIVLDHAERPLG